MYRGLSSRLVPSRSDQNSWNRLCRMPNVVSSSRAIAIVALSGADARVEPDEQAMFGHPGRHDEAGKAPKSPPHFRARTMMQPPLVPSSGFTFACSMSVEPSQAPIGRVLRREPRLLPQSQARNPRSTFQTDGGSGPCR